MASYNVLIADSSAGICSLVAFALEGRFGVSTFESTDPKACFELVKTIGGIDLVIVGESKLFSDLIEYLRTPNQQTKFIICYSGVLLPPLKLAQFVGFAHRDRLIEEISQLVQKQFFPIEDSQKIKSESLCPIRPMLLLYSSPLVGDVFLRLAENHYITVLKENDSFTEGDLIQYQAKRKSELLYVKRSQAAAFLARFNLELESISKSKALKREVVEEIMLDLHLSAHQALNELGVTEDVKEMVQLNAQLMLKNLNKHSDLEGMLSRFSRERGKYITKHSLMLGEVACAFASRLGWASDQTFQKLILAALVHDMTLKGDEMAKASSLEEVKNNPELILWDTLEDFSNHPKRAADLINLLAHSPPDTAQLVLDHHESPSGKGFPSCLSPQKIAPLSCLFIISHDYVDFVLNGSLISGSFKAFLKLNAQKYSVGNFKSVFHGLCA